MPSLRQVLEALPHRDVRAIATRLGLRQRGQHHKTAWVTAIVAAWQDPRQAAQYVAALSPEALAAATRLAQAGELPAALFFAAAEHRGAIIRRPRPGQHWSPPPWESPQSVSEELYYAGLLAPLPLARIEKAERIALPAELQPLFIVNSVIGTSSDRPAAPSAAAAASIGSAGVTAGGEPAAAAGHETWSLLHDTAQALCFLVEPPPRSLLHGRWLAPVSLADLNRRLLHPDREGALRSHKQAPRLRLLFFLLEAAELAHAGTPTPLGWDWLAQSPDERLAAIWHAWRLAPPQLRQAYRQPIAALPTPWPDLALRHMAELPAAFTAQELAQVVLGREPAYTAYFAAHLPDMTAFDAAIAALLETLAADWGALEVARDAGARPHLPHVYMLTPVGRWLIAGAAGPLPALAETTSVSDAHLQTLPDGGWQVAIGMGVNPRALADLAVCARYQEFAQRPLRHVYRLDEATVAAAAAAGWGLAQVFLAFAAARVRLTPEQITALHAWHARGNELRLLAVPLLRAARPELLAQLLAQADVRAGLGDLLSPTVAVVTIPPAELVDRLRAAGFYPQGAGIREQGSGDARQGTGAAGHQPSSVCNVQSAICNTCPTPQVLGLQSPAALWLAGQLYAALGEHAALPLPPPFPDLTRLLDGLPPRQQAVVQAQWETLRAGFLAALDGRTFAPPPQPSDPERWRPPIEAAIAAGRPLTFTYFTAGRNVLTRRTVTPYWIEEHRGIPYLRADCHLAGRVRLFRLDRIQELTIDD